MMEIKYGEKRPLLILLANNFVSFDKTKFFIFVPLILSFNPCPRGSDFQYLKRERNGINNNVLDYLQKQWKWRKINENINNFNYVAIFALPKQPKLLT